MDVQGFSAQVDVGFRFALHLAQHVIPRRRMDGEAVIREVVVALHPVIPDLPGHRRQQRLHRHVFQYSVFEVPAELVEFVLAADAHGVVVGGDLGDIPRELLAQHPAVPEADADGIAFGDLPFDLQRPVEKRSRQRNIGRVGQVLDAAFDRNLFECRQPILPDRYVVVHRIHFEYR